MSQGQLFEMHPIDPLGVVNGRQDREVDMGWVFGLMEGLEVRRRRSQLAKVALSGLLPETWQQYRDVLGCITTDYKSRHKIPEEDMAAFAGISSYMEEAALYDDAAASIRGAGEQLVALLLKHWSPGMHVVEGNTYLIQTDLKNRTWFCRIREDEPDLIYFNRWDNIPVGRAATLYEYCELLVDTQFAVHYELLENPGLYT